MEKDGDSYIGSELEIFRLAKNWKRYFSKLLQPYLGQSVLEVGAGLGGTTEVLCTDKQKEWICVEPDKSLAAQILALRDTQRIPATCQVVQGYIADVESDKLFDSVIYIDVMEHIEDDHAEVRKALQRLRPGGYLIVLVPAHNFLFSPFDRAIGHFRRYNRSMIRNLESDTQQGRLVLSRYLDSVGFFASLANRLFLQQANPSVSQIRFWDSYLVPLSRFVDPLLLYGAGKSVLGVWQRPESLSPLKPKESLSQRS